MNNELCEVANNHRTGLTNAIRVRVGPASDVTQPAPGNSPSTVLDFSPLVLACMASRKLQQRSQRPRTVGFEYQRVTSV